MPDITTQWDTRITGNGLNESPASYHTFRIWCKNPEWNLKQLAKYTNRKYKQVREWSSKYHYPTRKQAYIDHIHQELLEKELIIKKRRLDAHIQRQNNDEKLLDKDQEITLQLQTQILEPLINGQQPSKEDLQTYMQKLDAYQKANKDNATTTLTTLKSISEGINTEHYKKEDISPAARELIEGIDKRRQQE
jgi:hypothetical protein